MPVGVKREDIISALSGNFQNFYENAVKKAVDATSQKETYDVSKEIDEFKKVQDILSKAFKEDYSKKN